MQSSSNALERLIQQFAQPMAFLRELVQNSLDADTTIIEIETGLDPTSDCCFLSVQDNGSGMTEEIIDNRLTRLFASTKEDDLTKIGKFGIGFVSIFAVKPKLVVLETGCEGESWRVLFKPDRSFEKRRLKEKVEGTQVTLYIPREVMTLDKLGEKAKDTVVFWCKFSETEILFNGQPINQKFGFQKALYQYRFKEGSTEASLFPAPEFGGYHGYYNRGLTLLEGPDGPLNQVAFRVRSPYLEHTLSRDNILKDANYERVLQRLAKAAYEEMPEDLFRRLSKAMQEESKASPEPDIPTSVLWELASVTLKLPSAHSVVENIPVFPGREDELLSLKELPDTIFYHSSRDEFWRAVEPLNCTLLRLDYPKILEVLERAARTTVNIKDRLFHYRSVGPDREQAKLLSALTKVADGRPYFLTEFQHQPVGLDQLAFYLDPDQRARDSNQTKAGGQDQIGLVHSHPLFQSVLRLFDVEEKLAISILVRKIHLDLALSTKSEARLLDRQLKQLQSEAERS